MCFKSTLSACVPARTHAASGRLLGFLDPQPTPIASNPPKKNDQKRPYRGEGVFAQNRNKIWRKALLNTSRMDLPAGWVLKTKHAFATIKAADWKSVAQENDTKYSSFGNMMQKMMLFMR